MLPGNLLADRFVIDRLAGEGGMGAVYRALDRVTGTPVAIKLVTGGESDLQRFAQEARVLSELAHPTIVRYVAHGATPEGRPFLAMEWLEGEDLAERVARAGLSVAESVTVARRVSEALALAHSRGVIHRDVKPSNVFLVGADPARAKLLDFGIVRVELSPHAPTATPLTRTGMVLGTIGYMSPEQALADGTLDARSDVFALGCLLFECLTGQPAFSGAHVVAVLAKVLREEAPRIRQLRADLSEPLDDLVARMLSKDKAGRPADGDALLRELDALGNVAGGAPDAGVRPSPGLSGGEQRLVTVILAVIPDPSDRVGEIVRRHGGDAARLANGALLVTLGRRASTSEQMVAAAACALELHEAFPLARLALAAGRVQTTSGGPPGPVIDQAAALLAQSTSSGIRVDDVTTGLLGERFEVQAEGAGHVLLGRKSEWEPPRTLLGKPTPCVGRDKELSLLDLTLRECIDESVARAVLVTGPAGQGKSRLRHEFTSKARERGGLTILTARADPVGAGSSFVLVRQLVRQAVGLREGDPAGEQHARLRAHVEGVCKAGDFARVADFLGELLSVPSTDRPSPQLRSARNDPQLMGVWLARSFGEWLAAECARGPVLVVLEDLHWGDLPSTSYLGEGLRSLANKPLFVLALGRPEVRETFPNMWPGVELQEVSLGRLTPRAAERLVRAALHDGIDGESVARIVERADGNAFYLEELIRRVAEGGDTLPETVLALVQARLERLDGEARRVVRAASIFGEVSWRGAIAFLVGATSDRQDVDAWLKTLAQWEILTPVSESRFPDDREFVFRHGLLREAAYAMLTDEDRVAGHRLAGEWLEKAGEKDGLTLVDHFEKGGEPRRAIPWLLKAAQAALGGGNVEAAVSLGNRGVAGEAEAAERGIFRQVLGLALMLRGDFAGSLAMSRDATSLLPAGTTPWFVSAAATFGAAMFLGDMSVTGPVCEAILAMPPPSEAAGPYGLAVYWTAIGLTAVGQFDFAASFLERNEALAASLADPDLVFLQMLRISRGFLDTWAGELGSALANLTEARGLGDRTGDLWGIGSSSLFTVHALSQTGHCGRTETAYRALLSFCGPRNLAIFTNWGKFYNAWAKVIAGKAAESLTLASTLLDSTDPLLAISARCVVAHGLLLTDDLVAARRDAEKIVRDGIAFPLARSHAFGILACADLLQGKAAEALSLSEQGLEGDVRGQSSSIGALLRLVRAESLHSLGRIDDARVAIREARDRVLRLAATLEGNPELRASYLTDVRDNARTLELARQWLAEEAPSA